MYMMINREQSIEPGYYGYAFYILSKLSTHTEVTLNQATESWSGNLSVLFEFEFAEQIISS